MKTMLLTLILGASSAFAVPSSAIQVYAMDASGMEYPTLYTESAWQWLEVPLSALGNTLPSDLSMTASGLPEGTTITLKAKKMRDAMVLLRVEVKRSATAKKSMVNALASLTLMSGTQELAVVKIPVWGAGYDR